MIIKEIFEATEKRFKKDQKNINNTIQLIKNGAKSIEIDNKEHVKEFLSRIEKKSTTLHHFQERIILGNDLFDSNYLEKGYKIAQTVGRITVVDVYGNNQGYGTGFFVSKNLIMTNNHVLSSVQEAENSFIQMNYEYDAHGNFKQSYTIKLRPDIFFISNYKLDYTIVAVNSLTVNGSNSLIFGFNKLIEETGKVLIGQHVSIIQHPYGQHKQVALRENQVINFTSDFIHYKTDTSPGSSGSPVYNDDWEIVGLHHSGVPERDLHGNIILNNGQLWKSELDNNNIKWKANEGVRISQIVKDIKNSISLNNAEIKMVDAMLNLKETTSITTPIFNTFLNIATTEFQNHNSITITIPLYPFEINKKSIENDHKNKNSLEKFKQIIRYEFNIDIKSLDNVNQELKVRWNSELTQVFSEIGQVNNEHLTLSETKIKTDENPWSIAQQLEAIEGISNVTPDLPTRGIERNHNNVYELMNESLRRPKIDGSNKKEKEKEFPGLVPDWHHDITKFKQAIDFMKDNGTYIGIDATSIVQIDTGYLNHPELKRIDPTLGHDFKDNDNDAYDRNRWWPDLGAIENQGHGIRTASIIVGDNTGLKLDYTNGVTPDIKLIQYRVADSVVVVHSHSNITKAIIQAIKKGYEVITMSMGGYGISSWRNAAKLAYDKGVFWVCAAGNQVRYIVVWPAKYPGTIAVAATDYQNEPWKATSRGKEVDISAPGHNIYVPSFYNGQPIYNYGSGTSYATPQVAAAAMLWLHHNKEGLKEYSKPWQKIEAFKLMMKKTATKPEGWDNNKYGAGILNVEELIKSPLPKANELTYAYPQDFLEEMETQTLKDKEAAMRKWNEKA